MIWIIAKLCYFSFYFDFFWFHCPFSSFNVQNSKWNFLCFERMWKVKLNLAHLFSALLLGSSTKSCLFCYIILSEIWASSLSKGFQFKLSKWNGNHWRSDANSWCNIKYSSLTVDKVTGNFSKSIDNICLHASSLNILIFFKFVFCCVWL